MKKIFLTFFALALLISCQKKQENTPLTSPLVFSINEVEPENLLKSTDEWKCPTNETGNLLIPAYAEIIIEDENNSSKSYSPEVFRMDDGKLYTQVINLPAQDESSIMYTVVSFLLYDADSTLIMASPSKEGLFNEYGIKQ